MLSHGGILSNCEGAQEILNSLVKDSEPVFLTWLPLSHSYEHAVQFVQITLGAKIYYAESLEKLLSNMAIAKPSIMTAVPRFYQNLYSKISLNFSKQKGFKNVFQLKGGIFNYLNKINIKKSLWKGECFVFDNRVSVKHKLSVGSYSMCRGCRMPVSVQEKKSSKYKEGISCPYCYNKLTKSQKDRFSMRQKQILIARKFNKAHIYQKEY